MRLFVHSSLVLSALALFALATNAHAQIFVVTDTTFNAANTTNQGVYAGYASQSDLNTGTNPASPTVSLVAGGSLGGLFAYNNSTLNISGGSVLNNGVVLSTNNNSTLNLSGGSVYNAAFNNNSVANLSGGSILNGFQSFNNSVVNVSGSSLGGGSFSYANGSSVVNFSGGFSGGLFAENNAVITVSGGQITTLRADNSGILNIQGGRITSSIDVRATGVANFFGTGLTATLVNANNGGRSQYSVSGTLADGTVLANETLYVLNGTGARFTLNTVVPEPGSMALFAGLCVSGASALARCLRRRTTYTNIRA